MLSYRSIQDDRQLRQAAAAQSLTEPEQTPVEETFDVAESEELKAASEDVLDREEQRIAETEEMGRAMSAD